MGDEHNEEFSVSMRTLSYFAKDIESLNQSTKPLEYKFILDPHSGQNMAGTFRINTSDDYLITRPSYVKLFIEHPTKHKSVEASYLAVAIVVDTEDVFIRYPSRKRNPLFPMNAVSSDLATCAIAPWIFYVLYEIPNIEEKVSIIKNSCMDLKSQKLVTYLNFIDGIFFPVINN